MFSEAIFQAVNTGNFDAQVIESTTPVLVDFWAPWCGKCRLLSPVLHSIYEESNGSLEMVAVDADANPALTERLGVQGLPTLLVYQNGEEKLRLSGILGKAALNTALAPWLASN